MKHFGRADSVQYLDAECLDPSVIELRWKRLSGGKTQAQTGKVSFACAFDLEHRIDHRRNARKNRRLVALDHVEHHVSRGSLGEERRGAADRKRKQQIRSRCVAEEELWYRKSDIGLVDSQHLFRITLGVVRQVVLKMDRGLGMTGRARREEPYGRIIPRSVRALQLIGGGSHQFAVVNKALV